jgi:hypothetical protein
MGPTDATLEGLAVELATAGALARSAIDVRPAFATDLRTRLLSSYGSPAVAGPADAARVVAAPTVVPQNPPSVPPAVAERTRSLELAPAAPRSIHVARRSPTILPAPRWTAVGVAAALLLSVIGFNASLLQPQVQVARTSAAMDATLVRSGASRPLVVGDALQVGDTVVVGPAGQATLAIADGEARLAGGAELRFDVVSDDRIILAQLAGRAYHRVDVEPGTSYSVETAFLDWTARGTAFDIDREAVPHGETITVSAIQHAIRLSGPDLEATLEEGRRAVVQLREGDDTVGLADLPDGAFSDPWLLENAARDVAEGHDPGVLGDSLAEHPPASLAPTSTPISTPSTEPSAPAETTPPALQPTPAPIATPDATPAPTPKPTAKPTPRPTPRPTPQPTPTPQPELGTLTLSLAACPGGVVLDWGEYVGDGFNHYFALRSGSSTISPAYPPSGGASGVDGSYSTHVTKTLGSDPTGDGGATAFYRVMAYGGEDQPLAASPVKSAATKPVKSLGGLDVTADPGMTTFGWNPFAGSGACYSYYKLAYSAEDSTPSYLEGSSVAWVGSDAPVGEAVVEGLPSGTYWFRLQAIRATDLGRFVVAQTAVVQATIP